MLTLRSSALELERNSEQLTHPHHAPSVSIRLSEVEGRICSIYPIPVRTLYQLAPEIYRLEK
jgi:hypothetical protein